MLSQFQASYQRVEQSLQRLTDSISAYQPNPQTAEELLAADDEVNVNLEQLVIHQSNHLRIQELRQTVDSLDETLKNTIKSLAEARKDILAIPSSGSAEEPRREVKVQDLLAYAKFISKTTVPPTFRKQDIPPLAIKSEAANAHITNGIATPPPGGQDSENGVNARTENVGTKALNEEGKRFLDPLKDLPFEPWPSYAVVQRGALSDIQHMIESGQDPESVLTAEEQAETDRSRQEQEERERLAEEEESRRRANNFDAVRRRPTKGDVFNPDDM